MIKIIKEDKKSNDEDTYDKTAPINNTSISAVIDILTRSVPSLAFILVTSSYNIRIEE